MKKTRKLLCVLLLLSGLVLAAIPLVLFVSEGGNTVGIIGGADGPTFRFFVFHSPLRPILFWACAAVLIVASVVLRIQMRKNLPQNRVDYE